MKTIAPAAMAAIEAGEAIVTGAVEIIPITRGTDALNVPATAFTGSLAARTYTFAGFSTTDTVQVSKPSSATDSRLLYDAYSVWPNDSYSGANPPPVIGRTWQCSGINIYGNNGGADVNVFASTSDPNNYLTEADAYAALAAQMPVNLTGYSTYKLIAGDDPNPSDNRGGLSLLFDNVPTPLRIWGGYGPIDFSTDRGVERFEGIGDRGFAQQSAGAIGGVAQGLTLSLSAIETNLLALFDDAADFKGASVVIYRLIFGPDGKTLLDAHVFDRGRIDTIASEETTGGLAAIVAAVESAARGLGRAGARMRADGDQRLISATDGYFKNCAYAPLKELFWGGKKPSIAATAVGG